MLSGIPYFGEGTQEITERMLNSKATSIVKASSFYDFIEEHINEKIVVIIDNKWLSWLNDISFNYRDKKCYLNYYTYKIKDMHKKKYADNNYGHLVIVNNALQLRYEYKLEKMNIDMCNLQLVLYNVDTSKKFILKTDKWYDSNELNIEKLYDLYINSAFKKDNILDLHDTGYHYISKQVKEFQNKEKKIRQYYELKDYDVEMEEPVDYRDVREYKYEELVKRVGLIDSMETYKIRRLRFESYLYCILRAEAKPSKQEVQKEWQKLGNTKQVISYGDNIKLFIKSYWLNNDKANNKKTYHRYV